MAAQSRASARDRALLAVLLLALAAGAVLALGSLLEGLWFRVPLAVLGGPWFHVGLAAAAAAAVTAFFAARRLARAWRGEPIRPWLSLRALFAAAVLGGAVFLLAVPEFELPWLRLFASGWFGLWAGFLALQDRIVSAWPRTVRVLDVTSFDLALVLLLTEGSLRVIDRWVPSPLLATADAGVERILEQFRQPPGKIRHGFPTNSRGHYDEEFAKKRPGERLVACIGDSFSTGTVPHYWHYTTVCERLLPGTRVDNLGAPGIGPPEYEILLRSEALPLRPDLVVIAVFVGNDVTFLRSDDVPSGRRLRSWLDRSRNRTWTLLERLARLRAEARAKKRGESAGTGAATSRAVEEVRIDDPAELERLIPWLRDPALEVPYLSDEAYFRYEVERVPSLCTGHAGSYRAFFRSMEALLESARSTPIAVLLLPDRFQIDDELWRRILESLKTEEAERDRPQRLIRPWLEEHGVPCVDLLPRMRAASRSPDGGSRPLYLRLDSHFNVPGNEIAGAGLADLVRTALE